MSLNTWGVAYRVNPTQDRASRYDEVRSTAPVAPEVEADEAAVHALVETLMNQKGEPPKPYAVYTSGLRDGERYEVYVKLEYNPEDQI